MFNIAICDDEKTICEEIAKKIREYSNTCLPDVTIDIFYNGEDFHERLSFRNYYDLIFLDIELYQINGIEIGRYLRKGLENFTTQIVYVSSKQKYAMDLFAVHPLDFLIKPISFQQIKSCIEITLKLKEKRQVTFSYKINGVLKSLSLLDIYYFESIARRIKVVHTEGEDYFYDKLDDVFLRLKDQPFILSHKSFIVNYTKVKNNARTKLILENGAIIPVSRTQQKEVLNRILEFKTEGMIK